MKCYPRPLSEEFINASPEKWLGDCCQWLLVEKKGWDKDKKPSDQGQNHDQKRFE